MTGHLSELCRIEAKAQSRNPTGTPAHSPAHITTRRQRWKHIITAKWTKQSRRHIMRCCRDYWRWRMPFRCRALRRRISIRYFSCCGWIIRRFSGRPATSTGIIRSRRILCFCRNTSLKKARSESIRRR